MQALKIAMNLVHYTGLPRGEKLDFHDQIDVLWVLEGTLNPKPRTLYPEPQTLNPAPHTPNLEPCTLYPERVCHLPSPKL